MTPAFEDKEEILIIGCGAEVRPADPAIGALWDEFVPRMAEIPSQIGGATYGLCCPPGEGTQDAEHFIYVAGVAVSALAEVPTGMVSRTLPAARYAVFEHTAGLGPALGRTFQYIFGEWLPKSDYLAAGTDFEYYDERFDPVANVGTFDICVPVRRR